MTQPYYTVDDLQAGKSIGFLVKRCGGLISQLAERRFAGEPVSFMQWMVMANLARFERLTASALAAQISHDMGALTRIVDELEKQGLARRERGERDRRVVEITLTPEGRRQLQGGKHIVVEMLNSLVTPFSREELETLIGLMQRMMARLQEAEAAPAARPQAATRRRPGGKDAIKKRRSR